MGYVTSLFARKMVAAAGPGLEDADGLLASAGLDPHATWDPRVMMPDTAYYGLLERIAAEVDVTDLPLRVGASMRLDEYGAIGLAFKAATTLRRSFDRVERYARLWTSVVEYELSPQDDGTLFILHRSGARRLRLRLSNEATLASAVSLARQVSAAPVVPQEVRVRHPAPGSITAHEDYFGCPVRFEAELDALLFATSTLEQANIVGDEGISRYLISHLDVELAAQSNPLPAILAAAKAAIAQALSDGAPRMADVARGLGLSPRSLHRRLAEHDMSFQGLIEDTRRDLAEGLLRDEHRSLAEIAFLTGFSDQSAFTRAFRRWLGSGPINGIPLGMRT